jgi:type I restriction enzyme S subunit
MKSGWQTKTFGEILEKTESINPILSPETDFEYIDVSSVSNQSFRIEETHSIKGKDAPSRARQLVRANDILFATVRPTLQRIAIVPDELDKQVCSTGYFVLRPKKAINYRFLFYSLFTEDFMSQMSSLQKGASYPAVTNGEVGAQSLSFPPLPEQRRIVGILDEALDGIAAAKANAEKNLQNARALFESHLQDVFTQRGEEWVEKKLGDMCSIARGGSPRPIKKFLTTAQEGINWIKIGDATASGKYIYKTEEKIIPEGVKRSRVVHAGDFLLSNSMSFGRPYIMGTTGCIHDGWLVLSDYASKLDQDYLYFVLGS